MAPLAKGEMLKLTLVQDQAIQSLVPAVVGA
jgi:hypothetical protein